MQDFAGVAAEREDDDEGERAGVGGGARDCLSF